MRPGRKLPRFVDRLELELSGRMILRGGLNEAVTIYRAADRRGFSKPILRSQNHKMTVLFGAAPSKLSVSE